MRKKFGGMTMKKLLTACISALLLCLLCVPTAAAEIPLTARSALLMERATGEILFAQNEHEKLEPASVTKIMTLLLTMEAIDSGRIGWQDTVTVSANAASMGGSQVYLSEGEQISVEELVKSVCVSSGNDAAVALAEYVSGVTELFVDQMNNRAKELDMNDTHFVNCTGLTATGHVTSAYDIALMSRELLLHHPTIRSYTTIWTDTIRNGTFGLSNTNKLVRYYDGCTGLKTGYTASAGYCMSATAEKDGMELIAVVMKGETADKRNDDARALLNYGFSAYTVADIVPAEPLPQLPVSGGTADAIPLKLPEEGCSVLTEKGAADSLTQTLILPAQITAPVAAGDRVGELTVYSGETELLRIPILAAGSAEKLTWGQTFVRLARGLLFLSET